MKQVILIVCKWKRRNQIRAARETSLSGRGVHDDEAEVANTGTRAILAAAPGEPRLVGSGTGGNGRASFIPDANERDQGECFYYTSAMMYKILTHYVHSTSFRSERPPSPSPLRVDQKSVSTSRDSLPRQRGACAMAIL